MEAVLSKLAYFAPALLLVCVIFAFRALWHAHNIRIVDGHEAVGPWRFKVAHRCSSRIREDYKSRRNQVQFEKTLATIAGCAAVAVVVLSKLLTK
jgi:hypothetical protein